MVRACVRACWVGSLRQLMGLVKPLILTLVFVMVVNCRLHHKAAQDNLKKFTAQTPVHVMNAPREGKPLLVLDLDHTLLDFSSKTLQQDQSTRIPGQGLAAAMKRPFMDDFLVKCYQHYDLVVWSQTSWRWLETKLIEPPMADPEKPAGVPDL